MNMKAENGGMLSQSRDTWGHPKPEGSEGAWSCLDFQLLATRTGNKFLLFYFVVVA